MGSKLDAALDAIERGLSVFPLQDDAKEPREGTRAYKDATSDPSEALDLWGRMPDANVGIWPGDGVIVIDVDTKGDSPGAASWAKLRRDVGYTPTLVVKTPSGGLHIYYKLPTGTKLGITSAKFGLGKMGYPGIDTRGHNGYAVWVGSTLGRNGSTRGYMLAKDRQIAAIPNKLLNLLQQVEQAKGAGNRSYEERNGPWSEGGRDEGLYRWACGLVNRTTEDESSFRKMVERKNDRACHPPLRPGQVRKIAHSAYQHFNRWQSHPFTDLGMAERFKMDHAHDLMFHKQSQEWYWYTGQRWVQVSRKGRATAIVMMRAFATSERLRQWSEDVEEETLAKELAKAATRYESENGLNSMVALARSLMEQSVTFDSDKYLMNVHNGTLNLRTGKVTSHRAEDFLTKLAGCGYEPDAEAPRWRRFMQEVLPDKGARRFMHRWIGYSLTGDTAEQSLVILSGNGRNGKSKLHEAVMHVIGDYGEVTSPEILMAAKNGEGEDRPQPKVMALRGARMVTASEPEQSHQFAEAMVKRLTGDTEVSARGLHSNPMTFDVTWKIWLAVNYAPRIKGSDAGIWRRIRVVPFTETFEGTDDDKYLDTELRREAEGILAWAVRGCALWQTDGLRGDAAVLERAKQEYREEMNPLSDFVQEECALLPTGKVTTKDLYDAYVRWYESSGEGFRPMGKTSFGRNLNNLDGIEAVRFSQGKTQVRGFSGIALAGD